MLAKADILIVGLHSDSADHGTIRFHQYDVAS